MKKPTSKQPRRLAANQQIFSCTIANERSRARIGLLAYEAAAKVWDHRDCTNAEVHQWAAGFIHGYLARKQERRGR